MTNSGTGKASQWRYGGSPSRGANRAIRSRSSELGIPSAVPIQLPFIRPLALLSGGPMAVASHGTTFEPNLCAFDGQASEAGRIVNHLGTPKTW